MAAAARVRTLLEDAAAARAIATVDATFVSTWVGLTIEAIQRGEFADRAGLSDAQAFRELSRLVVRALTRRDAPHLTAQPSTLCRRVGEPAPIKAPNAD